MTIGDRVRLKRLEKGMTQNELALKLGYKSKTSVAHIENGRDKHDRRHYEETNSMGPKTAQVIADAVEEIIKSVKG